MATNTNTKNKRGHNMVKTHVVEVYTNPVLVKQSETSSIVIGALDKDLPPNYRLVGDVDIEGRKLEETSELKPSILLIVEASIPAFTKMLDAIYSGDYTHIIVYDRDIRRYDLAKKCRETISAFTSKQNDALISAKEDKNLVAKQLQNITYISSGKEIAKAIMGLCGEKKLATLGDNPTNDLFAKNFAQLTSKSLSATSELDVLEDSVQNMI